MKFDWLRYLYIAVILILGLGLITKWNIFTTSQQEVLNDELNSAETISSTIDSPEIPDATVEIPQTSEQIVSSDIPNIPQENEAAIPTISEINTSNLISVTTDTLHVLIDKKGGDIVRVDLLKHPIKQGGEDPYTLLNRTADTIYIAQSGLVGPNGTDTSNGDRPLFNTDKEKYTLEGDSLVVDLIFQQNSTTITKRFTFNRNDYLINLDYLIDNQSSAQWKAYLYGQIKRDSHRPVAAADSGFGVNPFLGAATRTPEENYNKLSFDDLADKKLEFKRENSWVALVQHYFTSAWIPEKDTNQSFSLKKQGQQDIYLLGFTSPATIVEPGQQGQASAGFYAGPKNIKRLEEIAPYLDLTIDFGWLWWIAKPLFQFLIFLHSFIGNWGWAIIALTFIIKAVFFYPSALSYRSMGKMRKFAPKVQQLKEQFGDDRQKMSQEMMKLYKKEKINPMAGCLPMLIQMPVFIALYWVLMESVELRHSPFLLWITDLSVKDPYFIFPLLMGASMFIQMQLNPTPPDPMQAKIMKWMPVGFTVLFLWFPAGLVIYWVTNNILSITQQYVITKRIEAES